MKKIFHKLEDMLASAGQAEYYGVEMLSAEEQEQRALMEAGTMVPHAEPGAFQAVKSSVKGHGEQTILPDDCQIGDNELCYVEA